MRLSIAEVISKTIDLPTDQEKIDFLRKNHSVILRSILKFTYDPNVEFLVPNERPPWNKNGLVNIEGRLHNETRRISMFLKGGKYDGRVNKIQMERLFIELLEGVDDKDAEILANMIEKKHIVGIPEDVLLQVYPDLYQV